MYIFIVSFGIGCKRVGFLVHFLSSHEPAVCSEYMGMLLLVSSLVVVESIFSFAESMPFFAESMPSFAESMLFLAEPFPKAGTPPMAIIRSTVTETSLAGDASSLRPDTLGPFLCPVTGNSTCVVLQGCPSSSHASSYITQYHIFSQHVFSQYLYL